VSDITAHYEHFSENVIDGVPAYIAESPPSFSRRTAMFEQELEMEKRESSIVPLLLIVAMILLILGIAGYYVMQSRKVLSMQEATQVAASVLKEQGPATIRFHTGLIKSSVNDNPHGPHYRLLEKAGLVQLGKDQGPYKTDVPVGLTVQGNELLKRIDGVSKATEKDGTEVYLVPVAERRLVNVSNIKMLSPTRATVAITWNWKTNTLGDLLDASGPMVKSFNTWDRATLIQKYGADFYHAAPAEVTLLLAKTDSGWQIATD
jgi:hypothetical protein